MPSPKKKFRREIASLLERGDVVDLGCGPRKPPGSFGVDLHPHENVDLVCDLDALPWEIESNRFDTVLMVHAIEHLRHVPSTMAEIHRIARPGAHVFIETPHYSGIQSWDDPEHLHHLSSRSLDGFCSGEKAPFEMVATHVTLQHGLIGRLGYEALINRVSRRPDERFARRMRDQWEKRWSFLVRGRTLFFVLRVVK